MKLIKAFLFRPVYDTGDGGVGGNQGGWKMDGDKIAVSDGKPVYVGSDGKELPVDFGMIAATRREAQSHRQAREQAEKALKAFEGLDAETARKAIDTVSKLDAKKLIDAGEVDKVREAMKGEFTGQIAERDKMISGLQSELDGLKISNVFANSEFLRNNLALPMDIFVPAFRDRFKIENGKIVGYHRDGNPITSKRQDTLGENATPEEALQIMIESHPQKDTFLKPNGGNGSGNNGNGGNRGGARKMTRSAFEALTGMEQAQAAAAMRKGELQIID